MRKVVLFCIVLINWTGVTGAQSSRVITGRVLQWLFVLALLLMSIAFPCTPGFSRVV